MTEPNSEFDTGQLTDQEHTILQLIAEGHTNRDIAAALALSLYTINWYVQRIFGKLGVNRRTQAVATARALGVLVDTSAPGSPLPAPLTPLIGRDQDLEMVNALIDDDSTRLVTILGPGGIGKTRLALAVAANQQQSATHPVFFVPLDGIAEAKDVVSAVANAINFRFQGSVDPQKELLRGLHNRQALIVLDNFEHVLEATPLVVDLLAASPNLAILATSRERLNLLTETVYTLEGLAYPTEIRPVDEYSSVQLFVQAARRALPDFVLRDEDLFSVANICRLVEGMPLAIELAAGWVGLLTTQEIGGELENSLGFLSTQGKDLPGRHHSMRQVFEHSWRLLTDDERVAFKKLAVFRGSFDRAAAKAVAGASLSMLRRLYNKSLIGLRKGNSFRLHELVRQFAREKLAEELEEYWGTLDNHSHYYGQLMQVYESESKTNLARNTEIISAIQENFENILAGWTRAVKEPIIGEIGRYTFTMCFYLAFIGFMSYADEWLLKVLHQIDRHPHQFSPHDRMRVLTHLGWSTGLLGHHDKGRGYLEEALTLAQSLEAGHEADVGLLLVLLAWMTYITGDTALARRRAKESMRYCLEAEYHYGQLSSWIGQGNIEYMEGNYEQARQHHARAVALCERFRFPGGLLWSLPAMGCASIAMGDVEEGIQAFRKVLAILNPIQPEQLTEPQCLSLVGLTTFAEREGELEKALTLLGILKHHPRCGSLALVYTLHHLEKLRVKIPPEQYETVMLKAEHRELSYSYITPEFSIGKDLVDWLLAEFDTIEMVM